MRTPDPGPAVPGAPGAGEAYEDLDGTMEAPEPEALRVGPPRNDAAPRSDAMPRRGLAVPRVEGAPSLACPEEDEPEGCCDGSDMAAGNGVCKCR